MPDPVSWLITMYALVVEFELHTTLERLAWTLVLGLFAYGVVRLIYYGQGGELGSLFGRLLLAGAVLLMLPELRGVVHDTWVGMYRFSSGVWSPAGGLGGLKERLADATEILDSDLAPFIATRAIFELGGSDMSLREAEALVTAVSGDGFASVSVMAHVILAVLTPILFAIYAALVFVSGLVVLLAVVLLPLAGALLMIPGGGASWFSQWLRMYIGALFAVAFLPLVFGLIVALGLVEPTERMAATIQDAMVEVEGMAAGIDQAQAVDTGGGFWAPIKDWLADTWAEVRASFQLTVTLLIGWLMSLITMVVGFLIGLFLLFKLEHLITGFLGGITGGAGTAVKGALLFAALRGSRMLSGTGRESGRALAPSAPAAPRRLEPPRQPPVDSRGAPPRGR